jgi:hydrophobe/amphiphile efflux-1 (HAE1) family protein
VFSRFFIERPVFASVISLTILLAGLASLRSLPVAQYPDIIPPDVIVTANYPGATAETLATTVAAPLEQQINGVPDMLYMRSTASDSGQVSITVTFAIGTDPDQAAIDVNNRVQAAEARLPEEARRQGVTVSKKSGSILAVAMMYSPDKRYDRVFVSNYALLNVLDELKRTPGVGDASIFGAQDYSMRVWLKPDKLAQYALTPGDVAAAIREQNSQFAAGKIGQEPLDSPQAFTYAVSTQGRFEGVKQFEDIILRSDADGAALRLKDVARVELGAIDYGFEATYDAMPSVAIGIFLQPGANALAATRAVAEKMKEVSARFPEGIAYSLPFDTTKFVEVSIKEVAKTFVEAILLVMGVTYLFLQNARATLIPLLAVPVSLIGTFAGMYLLGFSINLLTLFGMALAIGIVVDDAIVVLENVERIMTEERLPPKQAASKAMEEVTGPIVAIVLALIATFVPVGFMGGMTGEMYKQFAVTIAVSVAISGIVALTLTPALCGLILKPVRGDERPSWFFRMFNRAFERVTDGYAAGVRFLLRRAFLGLLLFAAVVAASVLLFMRVPGSLVPSEDQGYVIAVYSLPPAASLGRTKAVTGTMTQRIMQLPETAHTVTLSGLDVMSFTSKSSAGVSFVILKDWEERQAPGSDSQSVAGKLFGMGMDIKDGFVFAFNPPPIMGISLTGGFEGYLQSRGGENAAAVAEKAALLAAEAGKRPELKGVQTTASANVPQYYAELDRAKAKALGVSVQAAFDAMQSTFGSLYVNDFTLYGRAYKVSLQSEAKFRKAPEDTRHVFVRSDRGAMVPLDALMTLKRVVAPDIVERFNVFPAAKLMGEPAPGYSSGQAIAAMEEVAAKVLPADYSLAWTGAAYQEKAASGAGGQAFAFGALMVFLILAAQYERWTLPLAVIMAVPFAVFGAVLATWMRGLGNDVYFQVGLLTLIGLGAKNAILIVEFAVLHAKKEESVEEAAMTAARLRFRPIVMTSLAFILGCVPLAISTGAGAASRHAIGTGVIGGMLAATTIGVLFVPLFYKLAHRLGRRTRHE